MAIKTKKTSTKTHALNTTETLRLYFRTHRVIIFFSVTLIITATLFGIYRINIYTGQFSDKDYARLSASAQSVLSSVSGSEVFEEKSCHYSAVGVYDNPRLFCSIELVTYMPYVSDNQAIGAIKNFEQTVRRTFPDNIAYFSKFYEKPLESIATISVNLPKPYPKEQCTFNVEANKFDNNTLGITPEQTNDELIALSFYCSTLPRAAYFPVVER